MDRENEKKIKIRQSPEEYEKTDVQKKALCWDMVFIRPPAAPSTDETTQQMQARLKTQWRSKGLCQKKKKRKWKKKILLWWQNKKKMTTVALFELFHFQGLINMQQTVQLIF